MDLDNLTEALAQATKAYDEKKAEIKLQYNSNLDTLERHEGALVQEYKAKTRDYLDQTVVGKTFPWDSPLGKKIDVVVESVDADLYLTLRMPSGKAMRRYFSSFPLKQ